MKHQDAQLSKSIDIRASSGLQLSAFLHFKICKEKNVARHEIYPKYEKQIAVTHKASFTVESAFVMPIFLFAIMIFLYFFVAEAVNLNIFGKGLEVARDVSAIVGTEVLDSAEKFPDVGEALMMDAYMEAVNSGYRGLVKGMSSYGSGITEDERFMRVALDYGIEFPIAMFGLFSVPVQQDFKVRLFNGEGRELLRRNESDKDEDNSDGTMVYVTETGQVYHLTTDCPSLKLKISNVSYASVGSHRNANGGKYKRCEECAKGAPPAMVYITEDGTRFHFSITCSALKRTIRSIPLSEAELSYRRCKRCGGKEDGSS